ncbi:MAG TPA: hypothetical protein VH374_24085 [Polyangia bacterium]|nr:hypothetical protein [Polyangia bacterium]
MTHDEPALGRLTEGVCADPRVYLVAAASSWASTVGKGPKSRPAADALTISNAVTIPTSWRCSLATQDAMDLSFRHSYRRQQGRISSNSASTSGFITCIRLGS